MLYVTATAPTRRRRDRTRAAPPIGRTAPAVRRALRLSPLNAVSLQVIVGLTAPLPVIQAGHWLLGWPSVAVMFGGL